MALAFQLVLILLATASAEKEAVDTALASDDECRLDGGCAVNALQLRGVAAEAEHGEMLEGSEAVEETNTSLPSCYKYGCFAKYSRYSVCQCNPNCHAQGNCCPDYYQKCWDHDPNQPQQQAVAPVAHGGSAKCSAVPQCANLKLGNGDCCPTPAGMYLGCCPESMIAHPTAQPPTVYNGRSTMTLYHQTSPEICTSILAGGFHIGHGGWCGDAIYFALSPEATKTKAITPHSGTGCVIEATVEVGHVQKFPCCRYCGGSQNEHISWTEDSLNSKGYQSIEINPGDGPEIIIYNNKQVLNMRVIPWNPAWMPQKMHYAE